MKAFLALCLGFFVSTSLAAEKCIVYSDPADPFGDRKILCGARAERILGNLQFETKQEKFLGEIYIAKVQVENNNPETIVIHLLLTNFIDDQGNLVGFCSKDVRRIIGSGEKKIFAVTCKPNKLETERENEIVDVQFTVTLFSGT